MQNTTWRGQAIPMPFSRCLPEPHAAAEGSVDMLAPALPLDSLARKHPDQPDVAEALICHLRHADLRAGAGRLHCLQGVGGKKLSAGGFSKAQGVMQHSVQQMLWQLLKMSGLSWQQQHSLPWSAGGRGKQRPPS